MQDGQDKAFKDVIEPLESVSLGIAPTTRASLADAGTPQEVGASLVAKSAAPGTKVALVSATQRTDAAGVTYYAFEFTSAARSVTRHAITTLAVANGAGVCGRGVRGDVVGADSCGQLRSRRTHATLTLRAVTAARRQGVHADGRRQPGALGQDGGAPQDGVRELHAAGLLSGARATRVFHHCHE